MKRYIFNICLLLLFMFVGLTAFSNVYAEEQDVEVFCVEYNGDSCGKLNFETNAGASESNRELEVNRYTDIEYIQGANVKNLKDIMKTNTSYGQESYVSKDSIRSSGFSVVDLTIRYSDDREDESNFKEFVKLNYALPTSGTYNNPSIKIEDEADDNYWIDNFGYEEIRYSMEWLNGASGNNPSDKANITTINEFDEETTAKIKSYVERGIIKNNDIYCSKSFTLRYRLDPKSPLQRDINRKDLMISNLDTYENVVYGAIRYWFPSYYGRSGETYYTNPRQVAIGSDKWALAQSFLRDIKNLFDKRFILPKQMITKEVYVQHIVDGHVVSGNPTEILIDENSNKSIISNQGGKSGYSEYYKIKSNNSMQVSKLLTLVENQKLLQYEGVKKASGATIQDAERNINYASQNGSTSVTTSSEAGGDKQVTVIKFYYKTVDVSDPTGTTEVGDPDDPNPGDPGSPGGDPGNPGGGTGITGSTIINGRGEDSDCEIVYTPSGEYIKPYLSATKYVANTIKYKLEIVNGEPKYILSTFNLYYLKTGTFPNVSGSGKDKLFNGSGNLVISTNNNIKTQMAEYANQYNNKSLDNIPTTILASSGNTDASYFDGNQFIPEDKYNGIRTLSSVGNYMLYDYLNGYDMGTTKSVNMANNPKVNVFTPLNLSYDVVVDNSNLVNHTDKTDGIQIQKNSEFTLNISAKNSSHYTNLNTGKYVKYYIVMFDFDVQSLSTMGNVTAGQDIVAGTPINVGKGNNGVVSFKAKATSDKLTTDSLSSTESKIRVVGVTYNAPDSPLEGTVTSNMKEYFINNTSSAKTTYEKYADKNEIKKPSSYCDDSKTTNSSGGSRSNNAPSDPNTNGLVMKDDAHYFTYKDETTVNIGRIYDFKITDCSDVDFKNVFRRESTGNAVNDLTGVEYYSGTRKLNIYSSITNQLGQRTNISINGTAAQTILPLGPYKHYNANYLSAPKMGYRISFDLKTSGGYNSSNNEYSKNIEITPTFYYISKDGKTYESNIELYYKNSDGKYVNLASNPYTIYFKPNDGYRSVSNRDVTGDESTLSTKNQPITIQTGKPFTLTKDMMASNDITNNFVQSWYGEFKLPNSTVAIKQGGNINNPLNDGYIGVKFNIVCKDSNGMSLSYNTNNKNSSDPNTTQWDYEGYMGVEYGKNVDNLRLQLEKGVWEMDNSRYNDIKGTVVLFDLDNRAANDFE